MAKPDSRRPAAAAPDAIAAAVAEFTAALRAELAAAFAATTADPGGAPGAPAPAVDLTGVLGDIRTVLTDILAALSAELARPVPAPGGSDAGSGPQGFDPEPPATPSAEEDADGGDGATENPPGGRQSLPAALALISSQLDRINTSIVTAGGGGGGGAAGGKLEMETTSGGSIRQVLAPVTDRAGASVAAFTAGIRGVADAARGATGVFYTFAGSVQSQVTSLVQGFNPAAAERFNLALADTKAALGEALLPLLESFTVVMRGIGDTIASLSPQAKAVIAGLVGVGVGFTVATAAAALMSAALNTLTLGVPALVGGAVGALAALSVAMKPVAEVQGLVSRAADALTPVLDAVGRSISVMVAGVAPLADAILGALGTVGGTVAAVFGRFQGIAEGVFAKLRPAFDAIGAAVGAVTSAFGAAVEAAFEAAGVIVEVLVPPLLSVLVPALKFVAAGVVVLANVLAGLADGFKELIGGGAGVRKNPESKSVAGASVGKAVADVQQGGIDDVVRRAQRAAFAAGRPGGQTDAQAIRDGVAGIGATLTQVAGDCQAIRNFVTGQVKAAVGFGKDAAAGTAAALPFAGPLAPTVGAAYAATRRAMDALR